jgi:hypothetical protein
MLDIKMGRLVVCSTLVDPVYVPDNICDPSVHARHISCPGVHALAPDCTGGGVQVISFLRVDSIRIATSI